MSKYVEQFFRLKCSGDILNIVAPLKNGEKEISEAMSLIQAIKPIVLREPMKYSVIDLCAGNSLTGIIAAYLLPVKKVFAVDIKVPNRNYSKVKRFKYLQEDLIKNHYPCGNIIVPEGNNFIIVASHPCTNLAIRVIDIYKKNDNCKMLAMLPCCIETQELAQSKLPPRLIKSLGKYEAWTYYLSQLANGSYKIDDGCLSPCRGLVISNKEE